MTAVLVGIALFLVLLIGRQLLRLVLGLLVIFHALLMDGPHAPARTVIAIVLVTLVVLAWQLAFR